MAYEPIEERVVKIDPDGKVIKFIRGRIASTDFKPVDGIYVGSKLYEYDTGKEYIFNAAKKKWIVPHGEGSGDSFVPVSGGTPVVEAEDGAMYFCGEVSTLSFTPPTEGMVGIRFTSGSTPTVLTLPDNVVMPDDWSDELDANTTYELNFLNLYGVFQKWT